MKNLLLYSSFLSMLLLGACGGTSDVMLADEEMPPEESMTTKSLELRECRVELRGLNSNLTWMGVFDPQVDDLKSNEAGVQIKITGVLTCKKGDVQGHEGILLINGVSYSSNFDENGAAEYIITLPPANADGTYLFAMWAPDAPGARQSAFLVAVKNKESNPQGSASN